MGPSTRLAAITIATQAALVGMAALGLRVFEIPVVWGRPRDIAIGVAAAAALAGLNLWLLRHAPANWLVSGVRKIYRDVLAPLFGALGPRAAVVVGLSAGLGEELFFRGLLQPLVGVVFASVIFGLAHVAGRDMAPFGVWAALMGALLGGLAIATGGLLAPVIAHGVYDALALTYIRRTAPVADGRPASEETWTT